jgi:hypothetical protein
MLGCRPDQLPRLWLATGARSRVPRHRALRMMEALVQARPACTAASRSGNSEVEMLFSADSARRPRARPGWFKTSISGKSALGEQPHSCRCALREPQCIGIDAVTGVFQGRPVLVVENRAFCTLRGVTSCQIRLESRPVASNH